MAITFVTVALTMVVVSKYFSKGGTQPHALMVDPNQFSISRGFLVGSILIFGILAALYTVFW
jgi:SSS family solute:Na+ symporter